MLSSNDRYSRSDLERPARGCNWETSGMRKSSTLCTSKVGAAAKVVVGALSPEGVSNVEGETDLRPVKVSHLFGVSVAVCLMISYG